MISDYFKRVSHQSVGKFKPFSEISRTDFSISKLHQAKKVYEEEEDLGREESDETDSDANGDPVGNDDGAFDFVKSILDHRVDGETVQDKVWNFFEQFKTLSNEVNDVFRKGQAAAREASDEEYSRREIRVALLASMSESPVGNQGGLAEELAKTVCFGPEITARDENVRDLRDSYRRRS